MTQQINLLQSSRIAIGLPRGLAPLALVVVIALAAAYAYGTSAQKSTTLLRSQVAAAESRLALLKSAMAQSAGVKGAEDPAAVQSEIMSLRPRAQAANELMGRIRSGQAGSPDGFSGELIALAGQSREDSWVTVVEIGKGGKEMSVSGRADRPEAVILYAKRLNEAFAGRGLQFRSVELKPETSAPGGTVAFKIS